MRLLHLFLGALFQYLNERKLQLVLSQGLLAFGVFFCLFVYRWGGFLVENILCSSRLEKIIGSFVDIGKSKVQI